MSFHYTHNPYSILTQSSIPPFCCSFLHGILLFPLCFPSIPSSLQSPDILDGGFPSGPRPSGSPCGPKAQLAPYGPKSSVAPLGAMAPHVQEVALSDTDVSSWYICVFSSNITNPSSSSSSGKTLLY